jgi:hypothetical protein
MVRNVGQMLYNVSVPDEGIDQDVAVGQTITVHVKIGGAPVVYFCKSQNTRDDRQPGLRRLMVTTATSSHSP